MRLALVLLGAGIATMLVEIFVVQTPYSPYQLALPIAPFEQLHESAVVLALLALALGVAVPRLARSAADEPWLLFGLFATGSVGTLATLAVAASLGMNAVQIIDPRPGSSVIFAVRALFGLFLLSAFVVASRRVFRRTPKP